MKRTAGVLLHPTSLPGGYGIGDLGPEADRFLAWAEAAGFALWQVLPLGPPAVAGSPYTSLSTFAGNPMLISPELLVHEGLLAGDGLAEAAGFGDGHIAFGRLESWKHALLRRSWERFRSHSRPASRAELDSFTAHPDQRPWLEDWVLFAALRERFGGREWQSWPPPLARREPRALAEARSELADELDFQRYLQWLFWSQWQRLRTNARERGIEVLGDLPIYVAADSAEVWAEPHLFDLDDGGRPRHVAGVPPDYFTEDGQLWGHPLYRWRRMAEEGYRWWIERLTAGLRAADRLRIDHFRAFAAYWQVSAGAATAREGRWVEGPGIELFEALRDALGELALVAEDLGDVDEKVHELRRAVGLPGMRVLQFGFEPGDRLHAPHRHERRAVVYSGTHDNDTAAGWYRSLDPAGRRRLRDYAGIGGHDVAWGLVRLAYTSVAELAVVPVQDVLGLGSEARLNTPGHGEGNWSWRLRPGQLEATVGQRLRRLAEVSGRSPRDAVSTGQSE